MPSDLLYEENTITFRSVTRGRCGLSGRCSSEHRNRHPSAGGGHSSTGAGLCIAGTILRPASSGGRSGARHRGCAAPILWVSASLVRIPGMGTSTRLGLPSVTVGGQPRTQSDQARGRNARSGLFRRLTRAGRSDAWSTTASERVTRPPGKLQSAKAQKQSSAPPPFLV